MTDDDYLDAEQLAADLIARRATDGNPMRGPFHRGYGRAAHAHGYGWAGEWPSSRCGHSRSPVPTVEGVAAWIVWCAEFLQHEEGS